MPKRQFGDGPVTVTKPYRDAAGFPSTHTVVIEIETDGQVDRITTSDYNAWRLFGALSIALGLPLPPAVSKAIVF